MRVQSETIFRFTPTGVGTMRGLVGVWVAVKRFTPTGVGTILDGGG